MGIYPTLYLAFDSQTLADEAVMQHICLCRNEDMLLPESEVVDMTEAQFSDLDGFELRFGESEQSFLIGYNRFDSNQPMYGWLEISGTPVFNL